MTRAGQGKGLGREPGLGKVEKRPGQDKGCVWI